MRPIFHERARHSKRLGHVQNWPGPANLVLAGKNVATTLTSTVSGHQTSTNAVQPLLPPTPTANVSDSASSSMTHATSAIPTAATPSAESSASLQFVTIATTTTPVSFSVSASLSPSTDSPQATPSAAVSGGLSGGAIAGIIVASVIAGVALLAFCLRKIYSRRRERQGASLPSPYEFRAAGSRRESQTPGGAPESTQNLAGSGAQANTSLSPFAKGGPSVFITPPGPLGSQPSPPGPQMSYAVPIPPPASYNNPGNSAVFTAPHPAVASGTDANTFGLPSSAQAPVATIKCSFVPTLPDELSISTGEYVRVLNRFDDGWALCEKSGGEQGMVPQECLEQITADPGDVDWRNARRVSSLNPEGGRF
ncbi:hypothetical protein ID866_3609 [Astraeus odoratus]|nr:hypothetical protein ID866_3609 [Astraeus odoratus]